MSDGKILFKRRRSSNDEDESDEERSAKVAKMEDDGFQLVGSKKKTSAAARKRRKKKSKRDREERETGEEADNGHTAAPSIRPKNYFTDQLNLRGVQILALFLLGEDQPPNWLFVSNRKKIARVVMLMVPGLEKHMFTGQNLRLPDVGEDLPGADEPYHPAPYPKPSDPDHFYPQRLDAAKLPTCLRPMAAMFADFWNVRAGGHADTHLLFEAEHHMLTSYLAKAGREKSQTHLGPKPVKASKWVDEPTPIAQYITSWDELERNGYVLHPSHYQSDYHREQTASRGVKGPGSADWIDLPTSPEDAKNLTNTNGNNEQEPKALAIDCEMVTVEGEVASLARISVVDYWSGDVIMDEFVKPKGKIVDYLTRYSGVTEELLDPVTTTLADIQKRLRGMIDSQTILMGHSLNSDLQALKMTVPNIIDTAILYPHPRGYPLKQKLKYITKRFLDRDIQRGSHDSIEDARAVIDLVKQKCEKGPLWGVEGASNEPIYKCLAPLKTAHIDHVGAASDLRRFADSPIMCESDDEVVKGVQSAVQDSSFVFAQLRDLEVARGWRTAHTGAVNSVENSPPLTPRQLASAVTSTVNNIERVWKALPENAAFIVFTGRGDERLYRQLFEQYRTFQRELRYLTGEQLSVSWKEKDLNRLKEQCESARQGMCWVSLKQTAETDAGA